MNIKHNLMYAIIGLMLGVLGVLIFQIFTGHDNSSESSVVDDQPIYWVAPMDPNFKRDKPGKSPMGMDLVPVFANENGDDSPGTIRISANVENNLGVRTTQVEKVLPIHTIRAVGYVQYNEDALVHIHPRTEGWIEQLFVGANGDYIEKGAPLYSLYSPELVNAQEEYLLALQQANKNLIQAAKTRLAAMRVPIQVMEAIQKSKEVQQQIIFRAPQNGFIDALNIREGFYITPSTTLMAIAGLKEVWIHAEIMSMDSAKIKKGQKAKVRSDFFPGTIITGVIDQIYPQVNSKTRAVEARIRLPNPKYALKPNMFVDITIDVNTSEPFGNASIVAIPREAVIRTGSQNRVVLALGEGQFKSIEVVLGQIFDERIEILSGLEESDVVVTSAQFLLDSESSINSDFARMQPNQSQMTGLQTRDERVDTMESTWTDAFINKVVLDERQLNIDHGELSPWNMPGMTMNFMVADDIDMSKLKEGMSIHIEVTKTEMGMFLIKTIHNKQNMGAEGNKETISND